ncbi:MAG: ion transporter [Symploca sp. SIO2E9]|nr:ion transporter [Symploca sp. SIO2E9]
MSHILLREKVEFFLEDIETPFGRALKLMIAGLVLLSSAIFVAQTYPLPASVRFQLDILDFSILVIFAVEYLLRFWCAKQKIRFFFSLYSLIDLMAILPFFLGLINTSFFLILREFRILRLIRFIERPTLFGIATHEDGIILTRIIFTLFAIIFIHSGLIYQVEHPVNSQVFRTFWDAVYFSIVTMTTVGFGDMTPSSEVGRLITLLMILTGIVLIPWQVGELVKQLVKTANKVEIVCPGCGWQFHDTDAIFCKICGTKLVKSEKGN